MNHEKKLLKKIARNYPKTLSSVNIFTENYEGTLLHSRVPTISSEIPKFY